MHFIKQNKYSNKLHLFVSICKIWEYKRINNFFIDIFLKWARA